MKNIDLYNFAFFVSGGFSNLPRVVAELQTSQEHSQLEINSKNRPTQKMQNYTNLYVSLIFIVRLVSALSWLPLDVLLVVASI